jgi:hypothetical protein
LASVFLFLPGNKIFSPATIMGESTNSLKPVKGEKHETIFTAPFKQHACVLPAGGPGGKTRHCQIYRKEV